MRDKIVIQNEDFDCGAEIAHLTSLESGGICTFTGVVRDNNEDSNVNGLFLEHYPGMTEQQIASIIHRAATRWEISAATVIHRIGALKPGDQIVFVGVAAAHRGTAFDACEFIIDFLKTEATFWKKETTSSGQRWLTTRQADKDTVDNWR